MLERGWWKKGQVELERGWWKKGQVELEKDGGAREGTG